MPLAGRNVADSIRPHLAPLALVIVSLVPLWLLGWLVEIALVRLWQPPQGFSLPYLSTVVARPLAGFRGLQHEIMFAFWLVMLLCFVSTRSTVDGAHRATVRFLFGFLTTWIAVASYSLLIALALVLPYDYLSVRIDAGEFTFTLVQAIILCEAVVIVAVASRRFWKRKAQPST